LSSSASRVCLHCVASPLRRLNTASTQHIPGINHLFFRMFVVDRCSLVRRLPSEKRYGWRYANLCISVTVSVSDCPHFLDNPRMRRWVNFHGPLWFETVFWHHPLLFSGYTLSLAGRVSGEQRGGVAEILSRLGAEHGN
jgi:hypothetical protein